jgi:hypothetical protein
MVNSCWHSKQFAALLGFFNDNNIKLQAIHQPHAQHPVARQSIIFFPSASKYS